MRNLSAPLRLLLVWSIRGYQRFISPALPRRCKYYPSCSQYAVDALVHYGVLRGVVLAGWRLLRCNPFSYGGYDPVERQKLFAQRVAGSGQPASGLVNAHIHQRPGGVTGCYQPSDCSPADCKHSDAGRFQAGHAA